MAADGFIFTTHDARRIKRVVDLAENHGRTMGNFGGVPAFDQLFAGAWDGYCRIRGKRFQMDMTQPQPYVVVHFDGTAPTWFAGPDPEQDNEFQATFRTADISGGLYA